MSKKITMDYDEYLKLKEKNEKYNDLEQSFKDEGKCLYIISDFSLYCDINIKILTIPDAVKETIRYMSIKEFKKLKKETK